MPPIQRRIFRAKGCKSVVKLFSRGLFEFWILNFKSQDFVIMFTEKKILLYRLEIINYLLSEVFLCYIIIGKHAGMCYTRKSVR